MKPSKPQQAARELDQPQAVRGVLLVADQQAPALRQPGQRPLDHPTPRLRRAPRTVAPRRASPGRRADIPPPRRRIGPSGCRNPDRPRAAAWCRADRRPPLRSSPPATCSRGRWPPRSPRRADHPAHRRARSSWCRPCRDPWGWARRNPPKTRLAHRAVDGLPIPGDCLQLLALGHEHGPDPLHDAVLAPPLEPAVDGAVVAELRRQLVPLASGAESEDDAVEDPPPIGPRPADIRRWRAVLLKDREDAGPESVGDFPDRVERLPWGTSLLWPGLIIATTSVDARPF